MLTDRAGLALEEGEKVCDCGTYEGLNPIGHAKYVGMPVIVRGSRSSRHFSDVVSAEALCESRGAGG